MRGIPSGRRRRVVPVVVAAALALAAGVLAGARAPSEDERVADRFARAWARGDHAAMHALLTPEARARHPLPAFVAAHREAAATATARRLRVEGRARGDEGLVRVPVAVDTRAFGTVRATLALPVEGGGDRVGVRWAAHLAFPGVRAGERLTRRTRMPARAAMLARDGIPLAAGPARASPLGAVASPAVGELGTVPEARAARARALGYPPEALVGLSGLERAFDEQLAGTPGGDLLAGRRLLARTAPRPGPAIRTAIAPEVQRAAVAALGVRLGAIVALRPATGEVLALAGIALGGLQPPGSTFKVVTLAAALEARVTRPAERFEVRTAALLSGVALQNAGGEACGGTLTEAFAESCNSVFAPLGVRVGPRRLVAAAERFGFNRPPGIPGAATSTLPPPGELGDDLGVGSTAIGQGRVLASALQMAWVAATVADDGRRPVLTAERAPDAAPGPRVLRASTARRVGRMMARVVSDGTGQAAALPGVRVAGKTGTAELRSTQPACPPAAPPAAGPAPVATPPCAPAPADPTDTDAWFAAFAPLARPRVAVGVLLVEAGAGGDTAAPAAREVLRAAL